MEVRLIFEDDYIDELKQRTKVEKTADVVREAMALLDWASEEVKKGRIVMSIGPDGEDPTKITTPALMQARPREKAKKT